MKYAQRFGKSFKSGGDSVVEESGAPSPTLEQCGTGDRREQGLVGFMAT